MDEPEQWRWIWLGAAVLFGLGEMATPGAFAGITETLSINGNGRGAAGG